MLYQASQREPIPTPLQAFAAAWRHRELIVRLARKELAARLKGSVLGWAWMAAAPLVMLVVYTLVFANVLKIDTAAGKAGPGAYPLFVFSGLILFQMFADLALRGPNLLVENVSYVKKVIFPLDILAWVALARSLVAAAVSLTLLFAFYLVIRGLPPLATLLLPLLLVLFGMMLLGLVWLLAAFGVFLRDLSHLLASLIPVFMFVSPIFYSVADVPEPMRAFAYLSGLAVFIEGLRNLIFDGALPDWPLVLAMLLGSPAIFWLGFAVFARNRARFADVI